MSLLQTSLDKTVQPLLIQVFLMLAQPPKLHLSLINVTFTEGNRAQHQAESPPSALREGLEKQVFCSPLGEFWQDWYITWMKS